MPGGIEIFFLQYTTICFRDCTLRWLTCVCSIYSYSSRVLSPRLPRARTPSPSSCPCCTTSVLTPFNTWSQLGDSPRPPPSWLSHSSYRTSTTHRAPSVYCSQQYSILWLTWTYDTTQSEHIVANLTYDIAYELGHIVACLNLWYN
jgi:hypothetical protein